MSLENTSNKYEITLRSIRGEEFIDVITCSCIRAPFYKNASFWILKLNVSSIWAQQLINELSTKVTRHFELFIYEVDTTGDQNETVRNQLLHHRQYKCIHAVNSMGGYKINVEDQNAEILITLVDFILFDMSTKKGFNRRFSEVTAFKALKKYQKFIQDRYGEDTFYFNYKGIPDDEDGEIISDFEYKEFLLALTNDLQVPNILLYSKKAVLNPAFYFFDDFFLDKDVPFPITCHFINLQNNEPFEKFDIRDWFDTLYQTVILKELPISDIFLKMTQGIDSVILRRKNMVVKWVREQDELFKLFPSFNPVINNFEQIKYIVNEDKREASVQKVAYDDINYGEKGNIEDWKKRHNHLVLYVQDNLKMTDRRLKNYRLFIEARAKQQVYIQSHDCFCDWLQFGRSYNFNLGEEEKQEKYLWTPIAIENIFYKDGVENTVKHMVKSLMIEYFDNEGLECSICEYWSGDEDDSYCKLHKIAKDPESWCYDWCAKGSDCKAPSQ